MGSQQLDDILSVRFSGYGICGCRCGSANSAIFAEIVPDNLRSVIYAFDRSFEGAVAACGMPLVGESPSVTSRNLLSDSYDSYPDWASQRHA